MKVERVIDERGRALAVKRSSTPSGSARLRREADVLEVAAHPGLVELAGLDDATETELRTIWVAGPSLADAAPLDVDEVAGVVAAVASTLADLHAVGLVHGAVEPAHVVLDEDGRPVLCGLGSGGLAGERSTLPGAAGEADDAVLDPAADVAGLGRLLDFLLSRATGRLRGAAADAMRDVADRALGPIGGRPSARELADGLHDAVSGARLPRREAEEASAPAAASAPAQRPLDGLRRPVAVRPVSGGRRRVVRLAAVGLAGMAAVGAAVLALGGRGMSPSSPALPVGAAALPSTPTPPPVPRQEPAPSTTAPPPVVPAGCAAVEGPLTADVDGDGCTETVHYAAGVAEAAGRRWAVGQDGDMVAVGDWDCAGRRSLALLRPATGDVYAFSAWATAGSDAKAPVVGRVAGGRALRAADLDGDGCNELVVERSAGAPAVLHPPREPR